MRRCRRWSIPRRPRSPATAVHDIAPDNVCYTWAIGDKSAVDAAFARAAHVTRLSIVNNRLIPNAIEPRAANAAYSRGDDSYTLYVTSQNPHVERLLMTAFVLGLPEHKVRVIAPDVGGGFGSKIYLYAEETALVWAAKRVGRPIKWTAERSESFLTDAHGRDHVSTAELALDADGTFLACGFTPRRTSAPIFRPSPLACRRSCTRRCSPASTRRLRSTARCRRSSPTPRRSMPIAARAARKPPISSSGPSSSLPASSKLDPAELRRRNFIRSFPYADAGRAAPTTWVTTRRLSTACWISPTSRASPRARRTAPSADMLRGIGYSCYIEACGIAPSNIAGALGARAGCSRRRDPRAPDRQGDGLHRLAQPRSGARDDLRAGGRRPARTRRSRTSTSSPRRYRQGALRHGHVRLALARRRRHGDRQGGGQDHRQGQEDRGAPARGERCATWSSSEGEFRVVGTDRKKAFAEVALAAYVPHNYPLDKLEPGLNENAFYDPTNFTFPAGTYVCEVEVDPETGASSRALHGQRRLRQRGQSDDRRGPGARRPGAGDRSGAARG